MGAKWRIDAWKIKATIVQMTFPIRCQAIIWTNAELWFIETLWNNLGEVWIKTRRYALKEEVFGKNSDHLILVSI